MGVMILKQATWELLSYKGGCIWHDRRGETECYRIAVGTPWTIDDVDEAEALDRIATALQPLLGSIKVYDVKTTRDRVRSKRIKITYFDYQIALDGGRWTLTFKAKSGESRVSPLEIKRFLDSLV